MKEKTKQDKIRLKASWKSLDYSNLRHIEMKLSRNKEIVAIGRQVGDYDHAFSFIHIPTVDFVEFAKEVLLEVGDKKNE